GHAHGTRTESSSLLFRSGGRAERTRRHPRLHRRSARPRSRSAPRQEIRNLSPRFFSPAIKHDGLPLGKSLEPKSSSVGWVERRSASSGPPNATSGPVGRASLRLDPPSGGTLAVKTPLPTWGTGSRLYKGKSRRWWWPIVARGFAGPG